MRRGSLVEFLKRVERSVEGGMEGARVVFPIWEEGQMAVGAHPKKSLQEGDLFRFMLEIAQGMEYLHANGVLHGDLKAANVLVDEDVHCFISDFGQSEMKSEAYRISGAAPPRGTLRWQAPELMSGESQLALTSQMDVYAYAISCVEIVSMGKLPWPLADDEAVRHFVLRENIRPTIPFSRFNTPLLQDLLRICWHHDPNVRPSFKVIVKDVKAMRQAFVNDAANATGEEPHIPVSSPITIERSSRQWEWEWDHLRTKPSPDMRPIPLPLGTPPTTDSALMAASPAATDSTFTTADEELSPASTTKEGYKYHSHREDIVSSGRVRMPEPVIYTPTTPSQSTTSLASSLFTHTPSTSSLEDLRLTTPGHPVPEIEGLLLSHQFHPSLTVPLWEPSPVKLGAVGFLLKPEGKFVTLFNSFSPEKGKESDVRGLPSLYGYGRVSSGSHRQDRRNAAQRGYDAFVGLLTFRHRSRAVSSQSIARQYSFPLLAGHKTAHMFTESTMYRYMESWEVPKKWFKANKEDLFLVIGTLDAQEYALFVSHNHPDGQAHFNVFSSPRNAQPWGTFTTGGTTRDGWPFVRRTCPGIRHLFEQGVKGRTKLGYCPRC
ncbi:Tyrosine-protein kinase [Termitomyces sp. T112]|nr:Tyrosine-protein kinase [Termitomyces sp. T112]